jgi:predicted RNA-binding protein YlxR (DUF448 family)
MKIKKVPLRMCLGCQEMKQKRELIRVVKNNENIISLDDKGKKPGRGAYICKSLDCFAKAKKMKRFEKAFECKIEDEIFNDLKKELEELNAE